MDLTGLMVWVDFSGLTTLMVLLYIYIYIHTHMHTHVHTHTLTWMLSPEDDDYNYKQKNHPKHADHGDNSWSDGRAEGRAGWKINIYNYRTRHGDKIILQHCDLIDISSCLSHPHKHSSHPWFLEQNEGAERLCSANNIWYISLATGNGQYSISYGVLLMRLL